MVKWDRDERGEQQDDVDKGPAIILHPDPPLIIIVTNILLGDISSFVTGWSHSSSVVF